MARKIFEVEYDDDLHMADASEDPDYKRGLLYDDDGNLKAHAKMREIDEDELRDRYSEREQYDYDHAYDDRERRDVELSPEQEELARIAGEALAAMLFSLVAVASPHVKHWWEKTAMPGIRGFFEGVAGFFKGIGRKSASKKTKSKGIKQIAEASLRIDPKDIQAELESAYADYHEDMSSEEARKTLVEVAILASMLATRIKKLSHARITDEGIAGGYLGWQETVNKLTSRELIDSVNRVLEGDVELFDQMQIANMELILGRKLYENGQYIPIDALEFREKLMPGFVDGYSDNDEDATAVG